MKMKHALAAGLVLLATSSRMWAADGKVVWRIGTFDRSSYEFSTATGERAEGFTVGKSDPARDWHAFQSVKSKTPRVIHFQLEGQPNAAYRLTVAFLLENASVPGLEVLVNGHRGMLYLHPELDFTMGDPQGGSRPVYSHGDVSVEFPGRYLQAGENTISFQPVALGAKSVPDAGLNYDAVELSEAGHGFDAHKASASVEPTVYYTKKDAGLAEEVDVFVRYGEKPENGKVSLEIGGKHYEQPLRGEREFGEERLEFMVPEWTGSANALTKVSLHGGDVQVSKQVVLPKKKWTVYVVPSVHLDVGYTDVQSKVMAVQARDISEAMDFTAQHPDFKYALDAEMPLDEFMKSHSAAERQRVVEAIKKGQILVPAQYVAEFTAFPQEETLIRLMYPSANFAREHGTPFNYANLSDIQSYSWSWASVMASAGVHYFLSGSNDDRGPVLMIGHLYETPFWWEGPDGKKVLMWYSRCYRQVQMLFGLPTLVEAGRETLPLFLQMYDTPQYRAHSTLLYGSQGENRDLFPSQAELVEQWNSQYAYPHLEYSGFKEALETIAGQFDGKLPTYRGDGGPYWEDDVAGNPIRVATERAAETRALSAEKLQTIGALLDARVQPEKPAMDEMWMNMLRFDEHNAAVSLDPEHYGEKISSQFEVKSAYADRAGALATQLSRSGLANVANLVSTGENTLLVFNPLNWKRDGMVDIDLPGGAELVDSVTKKIVPGETVSHSRTTHHVRFVAKDVPAMGYKVYTLHHVGGGGDDDAMQDTLTVEDKLLVERDKKTASSGPKASGTAVTPPSTTMESKFYKVELDPGTGAVLSVYDKELQHELVDRKSPYRFGQYVYVTGGDAAEDGKLTGILQFNKPAPELTPNPAGNGKLISVKKTPYGWSAKLESSAVHTAAVVTEIRLFAGEKTIEFIEDVTKDEVYRREAVYFAFPFAMDHPQFQYEVQNGVVDPSRDTIPGSGKEWFTVQHWVSAQQDGVSGTVMPLDAELVTLGDIVRGHWPAQFGVRPGTIFSSVENNYHVPRSLTDYHVPVQQVKFHFRYVVTSAAKTDPVALSRMAWGEMTPIEKDFIEHNDKVWMRPDGLDGKEGSFLQVDDPAVLVSTWKPAEDGNGTIVRLLDLGGQTRTVRLAMPHTNVSGVTLTDAVERDQKKLDVDGPHSFAVEVHPHEIVTMRVSGAPGLVQ